MRPDTPAEYGGSVTTTRIPTAARTPLILLRQELGDVLRHLRQSQGRTLREVSAAASVSLGYLSEVERGEKEASSELLFAICAALDEPLSSVLLAVSDRVAGREGPALVSVSAA